MVLGLVLSTTADNYLVLVNRILRHTLGVNLVTIDIVALGLILIAASFLLMFRMR